MFEGWFGGLSSWMTIPLRLAVGIIFAAHGWQKFSEGLGPEAWAGKFSNMGIPLPEVSVFIVAFVELVGGICLVLGFFTRYSAALLAIVMIVAMLVVKFKMGLLGGYELDLALLAGSLALLLAGPGPLSLERAIFNREL
jgi:putative oxidoreductase